MLDLILDAEHETIQLKSTKEYLTAISVVPINIFGLREKDQQRFLSTLENFTNSKKFNNYQVYCNETGADTRNYCDQIFNLQSTLSVNKKSEIKRFEILEDEKNNIVNQTYNHNLIDKYYYIIFKSTNLELAKKLALDALYIFKTSFSAYTVSYKDFIKSIYKYYNPFRSIYESLDIDFSGELLLTDLIAPISMSKTKSKLSHYITVDKVCCKTYHAYAYPSYPVFAWISYLTGFRGVTFSMHVSDCTSTKLIKDYDKQYNNLVRNYDRCKKESEREKIKADMESVQLMITALSRGTKKSVSYLITLRLEADNENELEELENYLLAETASLGVYFRQGFFEQENLFNTTAPLCRNLLQEYSKDVVCNVLSWGFPMVFESLSDPELPILIGRSKSTGGAIFYDHTYKDKARTNSNEILFGSSGSGKTYCLMHLIYHRFARGFKQIVVDLEGKQMNKLTAALGGTVVNCANGSGGIINPLQIRITIDDDETGDKIPLSKIYPLASHIQFLRTFFRLYFIGLDRIMLSDIEDAIETLYKQWGFTLNSTAEELQKYKPEDYPIMSDLYGVIDKIYNDIPIENIEKKNRLEVVRNFIRRLAEGADSTLFNGVTNVNLDNDIVCLVLAGLQNKDTTLLRVQYYNILSYILTEIISGKFRSWLQLYEDEFHILMSPDAPEMMNFQKMLVKIIRKYNAGLSTSTQEISDVLHKDVAQCGNAVIGNSNYKFYFKQESESLQYLREHNMVSESDAEFLQYAERGQCFMDLGANALQVDIVIPDKILELFDSFLEQNNA